MFKIAKKTFTYGGHQVTLETGEVARQADAAVMVSMDDTVVLVTVVGAKKSSRVRTFSRSPSTTSRKPTLQGRFPAASSSVKGVLPRRKR